MTTSIVPYNMYEALSAYQRLQAQLPRDNPDMAIMEITTFLKMYPGVAMAHNDLGVMYFRLGNKLLSLAHYEKANRLQPGHLTFSKNLAEFYAMELGWLDDAIVMLTTLLKQYPADVELLAALGSISEQVGRKEEARIFYRQVLNLEPAHDGAREAVARLGQPAMATAEPAVVVPVQPLRQEQQPPAAEGSGNLQDILARLRATVQAPTGEAAPAQPGHEALYAEAQRLIAAGENDSAIAALERLVGLYPDFALAYNDLGVLSIRQGDVSKACHYQEMAVAKNPANVTFRKNLAELYYAGVGRTDDAIRIYTELLREYPSDVEVLSALAMISEANNLHDQARAFIRKVLDLEPWNASARDFLAGIS